MEPMKRNESRENEMFDAADGRLAGRRVCIVNGPVVLAAPDTAEGRRRFVVVAGTVVLEGAEHPVPADDRAQPRHRRTPLAHCRGAFAEFAARR